jgi:hypothetical protein
MQILLILKRRNLMAVKSMHYNCHTVTPYPMIICAAEAVEFFKRALDATEIFRLTQPFGEIGHAEIILVKRDAQKAASSLPIGWGSTQ